MAILSNIIDRDLAKKRLLSKMKVLCRDFNWEVRKAIAGHISKIFNLLDQEECDKHLFEIMVELIDDEENEVKNLAIDGFLHNIDKFSESKIDEECIGIVVDLIKNDASKELILEKLDTIIEKSETLRKHFSNREYYEHTDAEFRKKIIFNSPALTASVGEKYFMENIYEQYKKLLKDEDEKVRVKIASGIHEMISIFGTIGSYHNEFEKHISSLMLDKSVAVQGALLVYLDEVVQVLIPTEVTDEMIEEGIDKKISTFKNTFCKNFLKMEEVIRQNWRHLNRWLDCCFKIIENLENSTIVKKFLPVVITHLKKGGFETRRS